MYPITAAELPQRRVLAGERHERHLHNAGPRNRVHRQTHTVDRDGAVQNRHGGRIPETQTRRSNTNTVSEPSGRRSTTTQRGASASGDAGIPAKAATAPSPSHTGDCTQ